MSASRYFGCTAVYASCPFYEGEELMQEWNGTSIFLSFLYSLLGAYTAMTIADLIKIVNHRKWFWLFIAMAGFSLGVCAVWVTHFVGMTALSLGGKPPEGNNPLMAQVEHVYISITFEASMTVASAAAASVISSVALYVVSTMTWWMPLRIAVSSSLVGTGVVVMHYLGMLSQSGPFRMEYDPAIVMLSAVIGISVAAIAFVVLFVLKLGVCGRVSCSFLMATGVCAMHYTGMQSARYYYTAVPKEASVFFWTTTSLEINAFKVCIAASVTKFLFMVIVGCFDSHRMRFLVHCAAEMHQLIEQDKMATSDKRVDRGAVLDRVSFSVQSLRSLDRRISSAFSVDEDGSLADEMRSMGSCGSNGEEKEEEHAWPVDCEKLDV